jgi:hypothetical protein
MAKANCLEKSMGKWCEVKCNCENRQVIGEKGFTETIYACGHRNGIYLEFTPSDLFRVGLALQDAFDNDSQPFEIFTRIPNWQNYDDEYLPLTEQERDLWEIEIQEVQKIIKGEKFIGWNEFHKFYNSLEENQLLYVLLENFSPKEALEKTLQDGLMLIEASRFTGNPIEFYW